MLLPLTSPPLTSGSSHLGQAGRASPVCNAEWQGGPMMEQRGRARCPNGRPNPVDCVQPAAAIQHMRIHHGGVHIRVPKEFLHRPDVVALLQQMRGKTVSEGMATDAFVEPHRTPCLTHSLLQTTLARMMPPGDPGPRVFRQAVGRQDVWPDPPPAGMRRLAFQRERSIDWANPGATSCACMHWTCERCS